MVFFARNDSKSNNLFHASKRFQLQQSEVQTMKTVKRREVYRVMVFYRTLRYKHLAELFRSL